MPDSCLSVIQILIYCNWLQQLKPELPFLDITERELFNLSTENEGIKTQSKGFADVSLNACSFSGGSYWKLGSRNRSFLVARTLDVELETLWVKS